MCHQFGVPKEVLMQSLPGEYLLFESPAGSFRVTTHRVRYERAGGGSAVIKSMMLEEVVSCALICRTYPILLLLAAVCFLGGIFLSLAVQHAGPVICGVIFAIIFAVAYLSSREQMIAVASAGATIFVNSWQWKVTEVRIIFDHIESAKNERYVSRRSKAPPVVGP